MEWAYCPGCGGDLGTKTIDGKERRYCPRCDEVFWKNPKPVAWLLARHGETYLLVKRGHDPDAGTWDIPGGFVEQDESFPHAAAREFEEEAGVPADPDDIDLVTTLSFGRGERHVVGAVFYTELETPVDPVPGDEVSAARFWDIDELEDSDEPLRPACRPVFDHADV